MTAEVCGQDEVTGHHKISSEAKKQTHNPALGEVDLPLHKAVMEPWPHLLLKGGEESSDLTLNLP